MKFFECSQNSHPDIKLVPINTNPDVERIITSVSRMNGGNKVPAGGYSTTIKKTSTRGPGAVPSIEANGDTIRRNGQAQPGRGRPDTNSSDFDLSRRQRLASFFRPVSNGFHSPITSLHHLFREAVVQCDAIATPFERAGD